MSGCVCGQPDCQAWRRERYWNAVAEVGVENWTWVMQWDAEWWRQQAPPEWAQQWRAGEVR